jgi:hypothetical protein
MLRFLDHRQQPREVRDSCRVGVREFDSASVYISGGACHSGEVDLV